MRLDYPRAPGAKRDAVRPSSSPRSRRGSQESHSRRSGTRSTVSARHRRERNTMDTEISRRAILKAAGGTGLAVLFGDRALAYMGDEAEAATVTTCLLTPEATAGPYWVPESLTRRNVTEG